VLLLLLLLLLLLSSTLALTPRNLSVDIDNGGGDAPTTRGQKGAPGSSAYRVSSPPFVFGAPSTPCNFSARAT
jgi:hypothetical protein